MMMFPWIVLSVFLPILGGSGGELLEFIQSKDYWQAKQVDATADSMLAQLRRPATQPADIPALVQQLGAQTGKERKEAYQQLAAQGQAAAGELAKAAKSDDPEIAASAQKLLAELADKNKGDGARRLMAIRTLGELKDPKALPTLEGLLDSKEPFEAEFAARAVAAIEGKPFKPEEFPAKAVKEDLWLLPANCGVVGQASLKVQAKLSLEDMLKELGNVIPGGQNEIEKARAKMNEGLIKFADQVGNIRLQAVTVGLSDDVGNNNGFVVLIARGRYDPAKARETMMEMFGGHGPAVEAAKVDGVEVLTFADHGAIIMPSADRLIFVAGANRDTMPIKEMIAAVKAGKGKLAENADMAKLINAIDPASTAWAVMKVEGNPTYAQVPVLNAFKSVSLQVKVAPEQIDFSVKGEGIDAEKAAAAVKVVDGGLVMARQQLAATLEQAPAEMKTAMKPVIDALEGVKVESNGAAASMSGQFKGNVTKIITFPFMMFLGVRHVQMNKAMNAQPPQAIPAPNVAPPQENVADQIVK